MAGESLVGIHYATILPLAGLGLLALAIPLSLAGWTARARQAMLAGMALVILGWPIYVYAYISLDYRLEEVAKTTNEGLPLYLRIGASWSSGGSSLYLFSALLSLFFIPLVRRNKESKLSIAVPSAILALVLVSALLQDAFATGNHLGGLGINPILKNFWIIPHPLTTFAGYTLILAGSIYFFLKEQNLAKGFIVTGWGVLTLGLILGGLWSYDTFGWGGYWAWDPVETSQLSVWLAAAAAIHMMGPLARFKPAFVSVAASSVFLALYVTRSGVSPLHSFAAQDVAAVMLLAMSVLFLAIGIGLAASAVEESLNLRGLANAVRSLRRANASLASIIVAGVAVSLTSFIIYASLFTASVLTAMGVEARLPTFAEGARFYNPLLTPIAVAGVVASTIYYSHLGSRAWKPILLTMAMVTTLSVMAVVKGVWRPSPLSDLSTNILIAVLLGVSTVGLGAIFSGVIADFATIFRRRRIGPSTIRIVFTRLIHFTMIFILFGVAISGSYAFNNLYGEKFVLKPGESAEFAGLTIKLVEADYELYSGYVDLKSNLSPSSATVTGAWLGLRLLNNTVPSIVSDIRLSAGNEAQKLEDVWSLAERDNTPVGDVEIRGEPILVQAVEQGTSRTLDAGLEEGLLIRLLDARLTVSTIPRIGQDGTVRGGTMNIGLLASGIESNMALEDLLSPDTSLRIVLGNPYVLDLGLISLRVSEFQLFTDGDRYLLGVSGGEVSIDGREYGVPIPLSRGEYYYIAIQRGDLPLLKNVLDSGFADLLSSGLGSRTLGESPADLRLPYRAPEGIALNLKLEINGEVYTPRVRFDANGEAIGIHGLVIDVMSIRRGLTDIYITIRAPPATGNFGEYHELIVAYLAESKDKLSPEEYLGLLAIMSSGIKIGSIQGLPPAQAASVVAQGMVDLYIMSEEYAEKGELGSRVWEEGIPIEVKIIPGVVIVWVGGILLGVLGVLMGLMYLAYSLKSNRESRGQTLSL
ncbi:MAG: cytochrome c biogenesis protein CcsA [Aeropyrum sp.]|nr:cytochrome c biogenesis protein CcsA [Aeropyrum sp.]